MSWREHMRPASFRGVEFKVEGTEVGGGRRVIVNEYPQRDTPDTRDMGRKARNLPVTGFVIGNDYMTQRDTLIAALEEEGSGELIHPFYGRIDVNATEFRVRESIKELGMARFEMSFVESGKSLFPTTKISTIEKLVTKAQAVLSLLNAVFAGRYSLKNLPNWARDLAGADLSKLFDSAATLVKQADSSGNWLALFNGERTKAEAAIENSSSLAAYTQAALATTDGVTDTATASSNALGTVASWAVSGDKTLTATGVASGISGVSEQIAINADAIRGLVRGTLLAQGVIIIAGLDVTVYDDAIAARNILLAAIDDEMLSAVDDDVYQGWGDLHAAVFEDLTTRARGSARLKTLTTTAVLPALVLAYDLYEEGGRDLEIVARNAIANPNFVPVGDIRVLSA